MKPIYTNITTSPATTTLMAKDSKKKGLISKITISNFSDNADGATVNLFLQNASAVDFYFIKNVVIPKGASLVLEDNLSFDRSVYNLKMLSTGTSPALTVIIK
jgi:hypothetical protein|tara:strand:- start:292 stop:600 length:309 start_codon:yes stop_codon:yes gene_type:complete